MRTPAGIPNEFEVRSNELDADVIKTSVRYFTAHGQLEAGDYGLALVRGGQATVMTDSSRLSDLPQGEVRALFVGDEDDDDEKPATAARESAILAVLRGSEPRPAKASVNRPPPSPAGQRIRFGHTLEDVRESVEFRAIQG